MAASSALGRAAESSFVSVSLVGQYSSWFFKEILFCHDQGTVCLTLSSLLKVARGDKEKRRNLTFIEVTLTVTCFYNGLSVVYNM